MPYVLYRIIKGPEPALDDFLSDLAKCEPPADNQVANLVLWAGVSAFATRGQAEKKAQRYYPLLGTYSAELHIPDGRAVVVQRTLKASRGHHSVVACPEIIQPMAGTVMPIPVP